MSGRAAGVLRWLRKPLPEPPGTLRRGPFRAGAFPSRLRSPRLTSLLGIGLAAAFGICFATGLLSHLIQHPPVWFTWPAHPAGLYRFTQGLHVATGLATIPLLAAKLWSVYPMLYVWPPARTAAQLTGRAGTAVLVAAALFQLVTGVLNISLWYQPMPFFFTAAHYWTGWLAVGALIVHVGLELPVLRNALTRRQPAGPAGSGLTRRGLLGAVAGAAGVITVATVGQTVAPLARVSVLAPRQPRTGPQRLPVNQSAVAAGVVDRARDPAYRLLLTGPGGKIPLALADLAALPQHTVSLPITCVEGWSADAVWTGVPIRDLAALAGADPDRTRIRVESLQADGPFRVSELAPPHARDPLTLLALRLHDEPLHVDHGFPCRLVAPSRPGVLQTKWVSALTVEVVPW